jgi:hypothetical protein
VAAACADAFEERAGGPELRIAVCDLDEDVSHELVLELTRSRCLAGLRI